MILVDFSQVLVASVFVNLGPKPTMDDFKEDEVRYFVLNMIRNIRTTHKKEYGELVICCDMGRSWRAELFPYYKGKRSQARKESNLDWGKIYETFDKIIEEINDVFPYKVLRFDGVEADDIIGALAHRFGAQLGDGEERILIVSSDKDFKQLHNYTNLRQWTSRGGYIEVSDPDLYLLEQTIKGDSDDGVPNCLSDDNCIIIGKRQTMMTGKRLQMVKDAIESGDYPEEYPGIKEKLARNKMLVDLTQTPAHIVKMIHDGFDKEKEPSKKRLFNYFFDNKLKMLMENIGDFK